MWSAGAAVQLDWFRTFFSHLILCSLFSILTYFFLYVLLPKRCSQIVFSTNPFTRVWNALGKGIIRRRFSSKYWNAIKLTLIILIKWFILFINFWYTFQLEIRNPIINIQIYRKIFVFFCFFFVCVYRVYYVFHLV